MMFESIKGFATYRFSWLVDKYPDLFSNIKDTLPKANIKITYRTYISLAILASVISTVLGLSASFIILTILNFNILMRIVYSTIASFSTGFITFLILILYPTQIAEKRKKNIESNLPFVLTHMGAVVESGIPPYVIFRLISEFKEYGEVSKEMGKIVRNIDTFGIDPLTSIKQVAEDTPSKSLKQALLGFVTTTESGGNIKIFLKSVSEQALFDWRMKREKFLQQLSTVSEFYTGILIAAPLFIISLFAVMNMIQPTIAGFGIFDLIKISTYIVVPVVNILFLLFLEGIEVQI